MRRLNILNAILGVVVLSEYVGLAIWAVSAFTAGSSSHDFFAGLSFIFGLELAVTITLSLLSALLVLLYLKRKISRNAPKATMWTLIAMLISPFLAIGLLNSDMASGRSSSNGVLAAKYFIGLLLPFVLVLMIAKLSSRIADWLTATEQGAAPDRLQLRLSAIDIPPGTLNSVLKQAGLK